ncbi:MAG TPA: Gmad2 immunoglobulin-like domain-containing protein [Anaerolineales bacterium]|nr:Gmad2 immunoglobulin-like domain-containing protein [Anaerolineales bacterium]
MAARYSVILLLVAALLFGCRPATPPPSSADQTQVAATAALETKSAAPKPTTMPDEITKVRNGEYQLGATDVVQIVQLKNGKLEQGVPGSDNYLSVVMTEFAAMGDLNADDQDEIAVLVSENYGGSGVFVFLAVYANMDGTLTFQTSTMVDDRPQLNALSIKGGEIFLDAVIHGADEPMCCPTLRTTRHYRLVDNLLDMTDYTTFTPDGTPRTITIESPSSGSGVYSSVTMKGDVSVAPFENNLTYRIYDVGGIELSIGAIPVTAPDPGAPGTFNTVIPIGNVLSGTVVRIEVQDISAEDGSLLAMDSVELVVK